MTDETTLWAWFLFRSGVPTARAKALLAKWLAKGLTLAQVFARLPGQARALGVTPTEAAKLRPPANLATKTKTLALRWNDPLYPQGLLTLPEKLRPALLFYSGEPGLLRRPIVYLWPGEIAPDVVDMFQAVVSLLLGEFVLPTAFRGTPQAEMLLAEMQNSEGEVLLFAAQGVQTLILSPEEQALIDAQRLLIATPLPPSIMPNPAWGNVLQQVALAAARRCLVSAPLLPSQLPEKTPTKLLSVNAITASLPKHIQAITEPTELLLWLDDVPTSDVAPLSTQSLPADAAAPLNVGVPLEPPPAPEDMLQTLQDGGTVPEGLRRRLLGK